MGSEETHLSRPLPGAPPGDVADAATSSSGATANSVSRDWSAGTTRRGVAPPRDTCTSEKGRALLSQCISSTPAFATAIAPLAATGNRAEASTVVGVATGAYEATAEKAPRGRALDALQASPLPLQPGMDVAATSGAAQVAAAAAATPKGTPGAPPPPPTQSGRMPRGLLVPSARRAAAKTRSASASIAITRTRRRAAHSAAGPTAAEGTAAAAEVGQVLELAPPSATLSGVADTGGGKDGSTGGGCGSASEWPAGAGHVQQRGDGLREAGPSGAGVRGGGVVLAAGAVAGGEAGSINGSGANVTGGEAASVGDAGVAPDTGKKVAVATGTGAVVE